MLISWAYEESSMYKENKVYHRTSEKDSGEREEPEKIEKQLKSNRITMSEVKDERIPKRN